jgi:uncharacterized protein
MKERFIEVPFEKIDPDALRSLIEEYIERDGTFYGEEVELAMDQKVGMVLGQLRSGKAVIVWDLELQSGNIRLKDDLRGKMK